jgi:hypothetical protein
MTSLVLRYDPGAKSTAYDKFVDEFGMEFDAHGHISGLAPSRAPLVVQMCNL